MQLNQHFRLTSMVDFITCLLLLRGLHYDFMVGLNIDPHLPSNHNMLELALL